MTRVTEEQWPVARTGAEETKNSDARQPLFLLVLVLWNAEAGQLDTGIWNAGETLIKHVSRFWIRGTRLACVRRLSGASSLVHPLQNYRRGVELEFCIPSKIRVKFHSIIATNSFQRRYLCQSKEKEKRNAKVVSRKILDCAQSDTFSFLLYY